MNTHQRLFLKSSISLFAVLVFLILVKVFIKDFNWFVMSITFLLIIWLQSYFELFIFYPITKEIGILTERLRVLKK